MTSSPGGTASMQVEEEQNGESFSTAAVEMPNLFADMPQTAPVVGPQAPPEQQYERSVSRPTRERVLKRLSEALMRRSLTKIDLSQRGLLSSDAKLVKMALLQNANLSILKLGYNNLGNDGVKILVLGIAEHKALTSLDLGFNQIGDEGCRALATALVGSTTPLHTLYLAGNHIQEEGALALSDAIRRGCSLTKLHLTGNRIGPDGVKAITEAILEDETRRREGRKNGKNGNDCSDDISSHGVQELFLGGTSIGSAGCQAVAKMIGRSKTIRVLALANCGITDEEIGLLASKIKENRANLPLESLQLSFNAMTCKGLDLLTNAIWGAKRLRELFLDNNQIGDKGAQHVANILPYIKTLETLDVGFNSIKAHGMKTLMKVVAESENLVSLSVSGNPIDTGSAKAVAYALAYNRSLKCLFLDHCDIDHEGQRHIVAGFVSNSGIVLRKLTGFRIGPVIVTIEMPAALEHWTNEQVLNFVHLMWEQANQIADGSEKEEKDLDPLQFLPDASGEAGKSAGPLDATTVVEVAKRTFASIGENGHDVFSRRSGAQQNALGSPLIEDAIMVESSSNSFPGQAAVFSGDDSSKNGSKSSGEFELGEGFMPSQSRSFVAIPAPPKNNDVPDPERKKRIVDWLCQNIQHLNELSQKPFDSSELGRLHQHFFAPVVNESGGNVGQSPFPSAEAMGKMISSVPEVTKLKIANASAVTTSSLSSEDNIPTIPVSEPSLQATPPAPGMPMLKRKVSYRFLGEAMIAQSHSLQENRNQEQHTTSQSVARMIEDGALGQAMPPKTKRARRNKSRMYFLPRIKTKLESYLDVCHEKALILMRQLYFVEQALLSGKINPIEASPGELTHLSGVLADEAEMILIDMV